MKHVSNTVNEQVSALADGHLQGEEFARAIELVCGDQEIRATWHTYHLVGDVLRSGAHSACSDSSAFLAQFQRRLAAEPAPTLTLTPLVSIEPLEALADRATPVVARVEAANEPVFRWKLVAGAASLAAAAAIGWNWVGTAAQPAGAQLAQQQMSAPVVAVATPTPPAAATSALSSTRVMVGNGNPQVMLRDPRLDQLLEAHQQAGGASQMPSGFLRNATFDGPSR